jgi:hypothetical protein
LSTALLINSDLGLGAGSGQGQDWGVDRVAALLYAKIDSMNTAKLSLANKKLPTTDNQP